MGEKKNRAMELTPQQERFVELLVEGKSQREAYREAYPNCKSSDKTVDVLASKLFASVKIRLRYEKLRAKLVREAEEECIITAKEVLRELAAVAMANGSDFAKITERAYISEELGEDGEPRREIKSCKVVEVYPTDEIPPEKRAAIAGYEQTRDGLRVKTHDKVKALELLGKYFKLFTDRMEADLGNKDGKGFVIASEAQAREALGALGYAKRE